VNEQHKSQTFSLSIAGSWQPYSQVDVITLSDCFCTEMHTIRLKCFDDDNDDDAIQTAHLESFFSPTNPNRLHVATYEHLELLQMACTYLLQVSKMT